MSADINLTNQASLKEIQKILVATDRVDSEAIDILFFADASLFLLWLNCLLEEVNKEFTVVIERIESYQEGYLKYRVKLEP